MIYPFLCFHLRKFTTGRLDGRMGHFGILRGAVPVLFFRRDMNDVGCASLGGRLLSDEKGPPIHDSG
jgi:hypothetical protein